MRSAAARSTRRGGALLLVLFATVALGALAAGAVALTQSTNLVGAYQERERDFRYAAEMALAMGRARVERDADFVLPEEGYDTVPDLGGAAVRDAEGNVVPRTRVTVFAGKSGILSGQFGQFVTLVARADDGANTRYVRRLELAAENFARFAMFTNTWPNNNMCYTTGEFIRGLAWSNQNWVSCGAPVYYDTVSAVGTINTLNIYPGTPNWVKGPGSARPNRPRIPMPTVARLAFMPTYAAGAGLQFTPQSSSAMRLEFEAVDVNGDGDSTDVDEGFVRVFDSSPNSTARDRTRLQGWGETTNAPAWTDEMCGDYHGRWFFPVWAHEGDWMQPWLADHGVTVPSSHLGNNDGIISNTEHDRVMQSATARCFPAGSPQLVYSERVVGWTRPHGGTYTADDREKGGEDTTFTPVSRWGTWRTATTSPAADLVARRNRNEPRALFALSKQRNANFRGLVHVNGGAHVSGVLRSRVTLYASDSLAFLDDLTYVAPPNAPGQPCDAPTSDMLGIIAVNDVMIDDSPLHRPRRVYRNSNTLKFTSGSGPHFRLHAVVMSLQGTVGVRNPGTGPHLDPESRCNGALFSGGCIQQVGGVIEHFISATTGGSGRGFAENRDVDRCMLETSPPYFPTTGRYLTNRYFESDPARFNPVTLFQTLQAY